MQDSNREWLHQTQQEFQSHVRTSSLWYAVRDMGALSIRRFGTPDPWMLSYDQFHELLATLPSRLATYPGDVEILSTTLLERYWPDPHQMQPIVTPQNHHVLSVIRSVM